MEVKKIIAFAGSNSPVSINQQLIHATVELIDFADVDVLSLRDYATHFYDVVKERSEGVPNKMIELSEKLKQYDGYIIATPEHNGIPTAFLLNTLDWLSRIDRHFFGNKPVFLMSTSAGYHGGVAALRILENAVPRFKANVVGSFVLPSFNHNFKDGQIQNNELILELKSDLISLKENFKIVSE